MANTVWRTVELVVWRALRGGWTGSRLRLTVTDGGRRGAQGQVWLDLDAATTRELVAWLRARGLAP